MININTRRPAQPCSCQRVSETFRYLSLAITNQGGKSYCFFSSLFYNHTLRAIPVGLTPTIGVWPRDGFHHLVAGLISPTALPGKAKAFSLPVPAGQSFLILSLCWMGCSVIAHCRGGWAPGLLLISQGIAGAWHLDRCARYQMFLLICTVGTSTYAGKQGWIFWSGVKSYVRLYN